MNWGTTNMLEPHAASKATVESTLSRLFIARGLLILSLGSVAPLNLWGSTSNSKTNPKGQAKSQQSKSGAKSQLGQKLSVRAGAKLTDAQLESQNKSQTLLPAFSKNLFSKPTAQTPVDLSRVKPPSGSQFFQGTDDKASLERVTNQQIEELYKLTQKFKTSDRRGELWLRLAELYVEKSSLIQMRLQEDYDRKLQSHFQNPKQFRKPILNLSPAMDYNRKALQLYEWFVRDFSRDPKMDQALYFLGYNHFELGNVKKGQEFYTRLIKTFPRSNFVTESYFALAEYYFENEKWAQAHQYYEQVARIKSHRMYHFSIYKMAWSSYRSGKSSRALKELESLLESKLDGNNIAKLETEALRDLVLVFADVGSTQNAFSYFRRYAGDKADSYLERLGYLWADRGQSSQAKKIFAYLIDRDPESEKAFEYQYQIVKSLGQSTGTDEFKVQFLTWVRNYGEGSRWHQRHSSNSSLLAQAEQLRETTLRNWTLQQHQSAQKTKSPRAQSLAAEGYKLYLEQFPNSALVADMRFYYGEVLYDQGQFGAAAQQYRWVVEQAPQSKFASKAAENVVIAIQKNLPSDKELSQKASKKLDPLPMGAEAQNFVQVSQWFLGKFPQHKKATEVQFRLARLYYQHNEFDSAITRFREVILKDPKSKLAEYSANLILDIFNLKKDFAGLEKMGKELLEIPAFRTGSAAQEIQSVLERANFKKIQQLEKSSGGEGASKEAALEYEKFGRENLQSEIGTTALFNAAVSYSKVNEPEKALEMFQLVQKSKDKKSESLRIKSKEALAPLYKDMGRLSEAAQLYSELAVSQPKLHLNAGLLWEALGQQAPAMDHYQKAILKGGREEKEEAYWQFLVLQWKFAPQRQHLREIENYLSFGKKQPARKWQALVKAYDLSKQMNLNKETQRWRKEIRSQIQTHGAELAPGQKARQSAALFLFLEAEQKALDFRSLKIPKNPARQASVLQEKIRLLNQLNTQLAEVVAYDVPEQIVSALSISADSNFAFYKEVLATPPPAALKGEDLKTYEKSLKDMVEPFRQKAEDSVKTGIQRALELEVYTSSYLKLRKLAEALGLMDLQTAREVVMNSQMVHWMGVDPKTSRTQLEIQLAGNSKDPVAFNGLGLSYLSQGRPQAAQYFFERAQSLARDAGDSTQEHQALNNLAISFAKAGESQQALSLLREAFQKGSSDPIVASNLGSLYAANGDGKKALYSMEVAGKSFSNDAKTLLNYGVVLAMNGKISEAEEVYAQVLKQQPSFAEAHLNLAILHILRGQKPAQGLEHLERYKFLVGQGSRKDLMNELEKRAKSALQ